LNISTHLQYRLVRLVTPPHRGERVPQDHLGLLELRRARRNGIGDALIRERRNTQRSRHLRRKLNEFQVRQVFVQDAE